MPRKKTHEEFILEVKEKFGSEYEVIGKYVNSGTKLLFKHSKCGFATDIRPNDFLRGKSSCLSCSPGAKRNTEWFKTKVMNLVGDEFTVEGEYVTTDTPIKMKHRNCGNFIEIRPHGFLNGSRCNVCSKTKKKTHAEFLQDVFNLEGNSYLVKSRYINSNILIRLLHVPCGTLYKVRPSSFITGTRCPHCYGKSKRDTESFKELVMEKYKGEYVVAGEYSYSHIKIDILHEKCGKTMSISPSHFINSGVTCTHCSGLKKRTHSEFVAEVENMVGKEYTVIGDYLNNKERIDVRHNRCDHIFKPTPNNFLKGTRCPACQASKGEIAINEFLEKMSIDFKTQYTYADCNDKRKLPFDFAVLNKGTVSALIEYDGKQHFKPVEFFGGETSLRETQRRDAIKTKYCADNGIPLIRIPYWDFDNIETILTEKLLPLLYNEDKYNAS